MKFPKFKDQEHHDEQENSLLEKKKKKSQLQSFFFCLTQTIKILGNLKKKKSLIRNIARYERAQSIAFIYPS